MSIGQRRYNYYKDNHFLHFEAMCFKDIPFSSVWEGKRAYMVFLRDMVHGNKKAKVEGRKQLWDSLVKESEFNKWSKTRFEAEWKALILSEYQRNGWVIVRPKVRKGQEGLPDPYQMLRYYTGIL